MKSIISYIFVGINFSDPSNICLISRENYNSKGYVNPNIYYSSIYKRQDMEAT